MSVEVRAGIAAALSAANGEFDAAVVSLVLCSVSDRAVALVEIARVLGTGGELRFYEHVISNRPAMARVHRALDAHDVCRARRRLPRDTCTAILDCGFQIDREARSALNRARSRHRSRSSSARHEEPELDRGPTFVKSIRSWG